MYRNNPDSGSLLPLMVGLLLVSLFAYMIAVDVYSLRSEKLTLDRVGEDLVSDVMREISYEEYYFGVMPDVNQQKGLDSNPRIFLPITCPDLLTKVSKLAQSLPRDVRLLSFNCAKNQVRISITKRVYLPYFPRSLVNFQPHVIAFVGGGLQRVPLNY